VSITVLDHAVKRCAQQLCMPRAFSRLVFRQSDAMTWTFSFYNILYMTMYRIT
jgi:hypothetical protein